MKTATRIVHALIVGHATTVGGAERSLAALVASMPAGRCRYTVAIPGPGAFEDLLRRQPGAVVLVRQESWRWWVRTARQAAMFFVTLPLQVTSLFRWIRFLRRLRPDVLHCNISRLVEPIVAARALRIPVVVHFRDIPSRQRHRFAIGRRSFYSLMNLADAWIANSTATADDIRSFGRPPLVVIPNGLDLERFDRLRLEGAATAEALLLPCRYHVAMIAGLNPWKRQDAFVELAKHVLRGRHDVAFYLVGDAVDRAYAAELQRAVDQARLGAQVRFLGHVECVPALIEQLDVLVHTTPYEPFGRIFLEAMAARRPVLSVASGGAAEVVVHNETGVLAPTLDPERMATELSNLLDDEPARRRMGNAGRRRVELNYTMTRHCDAIADVYESIVS